MSSKLGLGLAKKYFSRNISANPNPAEKSILEGDRGKGGGNKIV